MQYKSLDNFLTTGPGLPKKGPIAMIFIEDMVEVASTLRHHIDCGFKTIFAFMPRDFDLPSELAAQVIRIDFDPTERSKYITIVNKMIEAGPGLWMYYCFNAEYLFYPFCETRSVGELLTFHAEERRDAMLTYVIDIYAGDLDTHKNGVSLEDAHLDRAGYYALARPVGNGNNDPRERQLDFFGGLRWRYEEHVPVKKRNIDRISLFRAKPGLRLQDDHTFDDQEYNTYACPWHNNMTAAVMSFRAAKALKMNPGSTFDIDSFKWYSSAPFEWHSKQLLELGLMEPGQWF